MCLTFIRTGFSRNKFFCMNSHKNVLEHTNCYTFKLNMHTDKVLQITFYSLSVFKIHTVLVRIRILILTVKKVPDPDLYPAPDHGQAPDPEKAPDPELAPEGPGSSDHLKKIKVPDLAPDPVLAPDPEKTPTLDPTITVFGWLL
jgi:hypothetical protein